MIPKEKVHYFSKILSELDHDHRYQIFNMLSERDMNVKSIQVELNVDQPYVSHQLIRMKRAGLLVSKRDGRRMIYTVNPKTHEFLNKIENSL